MIATSRYMRGQLFINSRQRLVQKHVRIFSDTMQRHPRVLFDNA